VVRHVVKYFSMPVILKITTREKRSTAP